MIALFPGSPLQDKMKDQAIRAQEILNKIRQERERVDSASTQEVLRDCNLEGIRDEVLELEAQAAEINCDLYQQCGAKTSVGEMKEVERVLNGDFRLVTQGLKQLEREMSDKRDKLPQLSTPTGKHVASSTGFHGVAGADTSTLDLGNKSPPPGPLLDKTGVVVSDL